MDSTSTVQQTAALSQVAADILQRRWVAGLALVEQIVEILRGKIDVQSKCEEGSTFTLRLPRNSQPCPSQPC